MPNNLYHNIFMYNQTMKTTAFIITLSFSLIAAPLFAATTPQYLKVTRVAENDSLNLRAAAHNKAALLLRIPADASGLLRHEQSGNWIKVSYQGYTGWVNNRYVITASAPNTQGIDDKELFCVGTEPHWTLQSKQSQIAFMQLSSKQNFFLDSVVSTSRNASDTWWLTATSTLHPEQHLHAVIQQNKNCTDNMSDTLYRYAIFFTASGQQLLSGCCK